ncbi:MAG: CRTAC1 family protein [Cytophagales bacterium]|nr:CRTAC1 family protein [Armatimonadota bacterium]
MFLDRSDLIQPNPPLLGYGVCVFEVNGDGSDAFFVAGFGFPNRALAWDGARLTDKTPGALAIGERQSIGVAAADLNGDGREELYVLNTDTFAGTKRWGDSLFAWRNGAWADLFLDEENAPLVNRVAGRSVCAVDRFGQGRYGFVVANYGGPMRLYERTAEGKDQLAEQAEQAGINRTTGGRSLVSLPLISLPGRMDLFAANENSPNFLFRNRGNGTFEEIAEAMGVADPYENGRGIAVLDADQNGRFDLAVGNWEGENRLFLQSPMGGFMDAATPEMADPSRVRTVLAADFDNDGYEEIFFHNIGQPNRLFGWGERSWVMLPIGEALEPFGLGTGAAVADLDGDGRLELLLSHGESDAQPLSLYQTAPNQHHWLRVRPLTASGAPARGAVVTLTTAQRIQRRAIDAGSGYLCQMEPVAHFGLGLVDQVEQVEIIWPGGARAVLDRPTVRQSYTVPFPGGASS